MKNWKVIVVLGLVVSASLAIAQGAAKVGSSGEGKATRGQTERTGPAGKIDTSNQTPLQRALWHLFVSTQTAALQGESSITTRQRIIVVTNQYMRGVLTASQRPPYDASTWSPKNLTEARWKPVLTVPVMVDKLMQLTDKQLGEVKSAWLSNQVNWDAYGKAIAGRGFDASGRADAMVVHLSDMTDGIAAVLSGPQRAEWQKIVTAFRKDIVKAGGGA